MDITTPIIFAILILGAFGAGLTELFKKIIKNKFGKFYKSEIYELIKLLMPLILCLIIGIFTPEFIFNLLGISGINLTSKIWISAISGLLSNLSFGVLKNILKGFGGDVSVKDRPKKDDEEPA